MSNQILFDNLIITDDPAVAAQWASQTFDLKKRKMEKEAVSQFQNVKLMTQIDIYERRQKILKRYVDFSKSTANPANTKQSYHFSIWD